MCSSSDNYKKFVTSCTCMRTRGKCSEHFNFLTVEEFLGCRYFFGCKLFASFSRDACGQEYVEMIHL